MGSRRSWGKLTDAGLSQATGVWGSAVVQLCPLLGSAPSGFLLGSGFQGLGTVSCAEEVSWRSFSASMDDLGTTVKELGRPSLRKMLSEPSWGWLLWPWRLPGREDRPRPAPPDLPFCALCLAARSRAIGEPRSTTSPVTGCLRSSSAGWAEAGGLAGSPLGSSAGSADPAASPLAIVGITMAPSGLFWLRWDL